MDLIELETLKFNKDEPKIGEKLLIIKNDSYDGHPFKIGDTCELLDIEPRKGDYAEYKYVVTHPEHIDVYVKRDEFIIIKTVKHGPN